MSVEAQIQDKIKELLNNINESIPVAWDELYVNIEMSNGGGSVYFDFKPAGQSEYHYSSYIPKDFNMDEGISKRFFYDQYNIGSDLWQLFVNNGMPVWSSAIISHIDGKMNVKFDYTPWDDSGYGPSARRNFYKYKYLSFEPRSDKEAQKFKEMQALQDQYNDKPL